MNLFMHVANNFYMKVIPLRLELYEIVSNDIIDYFGTDLYHKNSK